LRGGQERGRVKGRGGRRRGTRGKPEKSTSAEKKIGQKTEAVQKSSDLLAKEKKGPGITPKGGGKTRKNLQKRVLAGRGKSIMVRGKRP